MGGAPISPGAMGIYVSEVVWWNVRPLTFMLWGGAFERFPRLKVAIVEGTTVWVPEYLRLLDQRYEETHYSAKLGDYRSHLKSKPSEYFARNVFLGASCMPRREAELRHETGVANIVIWQKVFERHRRIVLGSGMIGVSGQVQREGEVIHIVAHRLTDLSADLASIGARDPAFPLPHGRGDNFHHGSPAPDPRALPRPRNLVDPYDHTGEIRVKIRDFR